MSDTIEKDTESQTTAHIRRASYLMIGSVLLSRVIGFFRDWVIARKMGATPFTDVYYASFTIPDFLNYLMAAGALSISFIPVLSSYLGKNDGEMGKRVFRAISTWMGSLLILLILVGEIFAPALGELIAPGFDPEQKQVLALLLRIILPAQFFFYWGGLAIAVQQTHGYFWGSAIAPILYNLGIIVCGVLLHSTYGVASFSIGVLVGCIVGQGLVQWWGIRKFGYGIAPLFDLSPEIKGAIKKYLWLSLPIMLGLSLVVTDEWISKYFASSLPGRAVTWLTLARTEIRIPIAIIAQAAGIASFPYLARLWSSNKKVEFGRLFEKELTKLWLLAPLATVILMTHALPITQFLFGGGKLTMYDLQCTSNALRIMAVSLFFWSAQVLLSRGFYACGITWLPSVVGTVLSFLFIPLYAYFANTFDFQGLAMAGSIGILIYTMVLLHYLRKHLKKEGAKPEGKYFYKFVALWAVWLVIAYAASEGLLRLNVYQATQLSALFAILIELAVILPLSFAVQRTLFKGLNEPAPF